jgi:PEGA domain
MTSFSRFFRASARRALGLAVVLHLVAFPTTRAFADTPSSSLTDSLSGVAKSEYEAGRVLFVNSDYAASLVKLRRAYDLSHDPRLLWDMAACEKNLRRYVKMHALLERYLADGGDRLSPDDRRAAESALKTVQSFVSPLRLDVDQPGADVLVDGESVGTSPLAKPVLVDIGTRNIQVTKAGFQPFRETVRVDGGREVALSVRLQVARERARLAVRAGKGQVIELDGAVMGEGQWEGNVAAGLHRVRIAAPEMKAYETEVLLRNDESRQLQVSLEHEKRNTWMWIAGGAAIAAGAAIGGYFALRPHDETERPTGSLGQAQLPLLGTR